MSAGRKRNFAGRPTEPRGLGASARERLITCFGGAPLHGAPHNRRHARTTDRIKVTAFERRLTTADVLRALVAHEFPNSDGDAS